MSATPVGTHTITGLLTCAIPGCDWTGWVRRGGASPEAVLILHRMDAHPEEYLRTHPEAAPYLLDTEEPTDE